jgi:5-methyltetrahydrofolate--homocysteine methyltransferase
MANLLQDEKLIIFDGACGTTLQEMDVPATAWGNCEGCNEYLNLTAPELIIEMHSAFIDTGAMVLETNTFGATRIVLAEYGLENKMAEINIAAVENARQAVAGQSGRYIVGSLGPTTKLVSLGHIEQKILAEDYMDQTTVLLEAGVDGIIIETCQDLLQVKTAIIAVIDAMQTTGRELPIFVSVTIEQTGTMLVGSDIATVCTTLEPSPIFSLGLNCATGPTDMESHIRYLSHNWPKRISCIPNQGLPEVVNGKTVYQLSPEKYAEHMKTFIEKQGVSVVGGCCGTSPEHIRQLVQTIADTTPAVRSIES